MQWCFRDHSNRFGEFLAPTFCTVVKIMKTSFEQTKTPIFANDVLLTIEIAFNYSELQISLHNYYYLIDQWNCLEQFLTMVFYWSLKVPLNNYELHSLQWCFQDHWNCFWAINSSLLQSLQWLFNEFIDVNNITKRKSQRERDVTMQAKVSHFWCHDNLLLKNSWIPCLLQANVTHF